MQIRIPNVIYYKTLVNYFQNSKIKIVEDEVIELQTKIQARSGREREDVLKLLTNISKRWGSLRFQKKRFC